MDCPGSLSKGLETERGFSIPGAKDCKMTSGLELSGMLNAIANPPCAAFVDETQDLQLKYEEKPASEVSSDCGYASSSDEEKSNQSDGMVDASDPLCNEMLSENDRVMKEIIEKYQFDSVPPELKKFVLGANQGLPDDYTVPIDVKPDWFDLKKYKLGQEFAKKYLIGVNTSEMMALFILFALPDGLETLIFSGNSSTPFTSFRRYLSTVLRVSSWYDYDIWSKGNPGYRNLKAVRAMHLNISKKINSTPYETLKDKVTLAGASDKPPIWKTGLKEIIEEDFKSGCPFKVAKPIHSTIPGKVFVNQLDMSTTQFGFVGLMIAYPEKFGAAGAPKEELEGFVHLWRCIGYLLGMEDKYNFCAGTLEEVVERCHSFVENWAKPNFQHISDDWEHMSRCLAVGMDNCASAPGMSFEVSIMYMCWVLDIPATRLYESFTWGQRFQFNMLKFMMTTAVEFPGVLRMLNWLIRRSLVKASNMPADELKKLEKKKYDYQLAKVTETKDKKMKVKLNKRTGQLSLITFAYVLRLLL